MLPILNQLKAETILDGTDIIEKVQRLKSSLFYKTNDESYSYEDYYNKLLASANDIEQIQLETVVPPGSAQKYLVDLTQGLQLVTDKIENVHTRALFFLGKINSAMHNRDNLLATFSVWYQIGASDMLKTLEVKVPASTVKALAESEFSRIMEDHDTSLEGMKAAIEVLIDHLKSAKKLAQEKYKIGTEQANASILRLPNQGFVDGGDPFPLLRQRYNLKDVDTTAPKSQYDDEDDTGTDAEVDTDTDHEPQGTLEQSIEHRSVPTKSIEAVVKHADLGQIDMTDVVSLDKIKADWHKSMEDTYGDAVVSVEDEDKTISIDEEVPEKGTTPEPKPSIDIEDAFLGHVTIEDDEDGTPTVRKKRSISFDDEEETPTAPVAKTKTKPQYDDEETEEPVTDPNPQKSKRARKQIKFDQPF